MADTSKPTPAETRAAEQKAAAERDAARAEARTPATTDARSEPKAKTGPLAPASESGDPDVHKLLADRQAHVSNAGLEADPAVEAMRKASLDAIEDIDKRLAELGFTAK
jgi:hypothetical protein